jgi:malate synthase
LDFTDNSASAEANDKIVAYRNWLGLMQGDLRTAHIQNGQQKVLKLAPDVTFTATDGEDYPLSGRSLMLVRCADHFMNTLLMQDEQGNYASESIVDTVVTSLFALLDMQKSGGLRNSRTGSIYMVKQQLHNPLEVGFTRDLFAAVEQLLAIPANTLKLVITNEPSLNSANVAACIEEAKERIVFINTTPV